MRTRRLDLRWFIGLGNGGNRNRFRASGPGDQWSPELVARLLVGEVIVGIMIRYWLKKRGAHLGESGRAGQRRHLKFAGEHEIVFVEQIPPADERFRHFDAPAKHVTHGRMCNLRAEGHQRAIEGTEFVRAVDMTQSVVGDQRAEAMRQDHVGRKRAHLGGQAQTQVSAQPIQRRPLRHHAHRPARLVGQAKNIALAGVHDPAFEEPGQRREVHHGGSARRRKQIVVGKLPDVEHHRSVPFAHMIGDGALPVVAPIAALFLMPDAVNAQNFHREQFLFFVGSGGPSVRRALT